MYLFLKAIFSDKVAKNENNENLKNNSFFMYPAFNHFIFRKKNPFYCFKQFRLTI